VFAGKVICGARSEASGQSWPPKIVATEAFYQIFTDRIVSSLKAGVIPCEAPWKARPFVGGLFPAHFLYWQALRESTSFCFGRLSTALHLDLGLHSSRRTQLKGYVRKEEHGTPIVFSKLLPEYAKRTRKAGRG
jgi:hypothetical protein